MHKLKKSHIKLDPANRLYQLATPLIGLTGSIATGKSTVAKYLADKGYSVIDADKLIKDIYSQAETINFIQTVCPESLKDKKIDFKLLRQKFFNNQELKGQIEAFLYQRLPEVFAQRVEQFKANNCDFIFYDVPLLFEKDLATKLDLTVTVYTKPELQKTRLIQRDNISEDQAQQIIASQMSIEEKRKLADFVIDNSQDLNFLYQQVDNFLSEIIQ